MISPGLVVFKDSLYAGTRNWDGAQLWRCHYTNTDPANWEMVLDFAIVDPTITLISYVYEWNDTLRIGTDGTAQMYQSANGSSWTKNPGVGDGFGDLGNQNVASMVEFNSELFVTTWNLTTGGQLWKSADGGNWIQATGNAFGFGPPIRELHNVRVKGGYLWVTGLSLTGSGNVVWRSDDGVNFVQSNTPGFGNTDNKDGFPVTIEYGPYVFYGGENITTGAQLWRMESPSGISEDTENLQSVNFYPNPFSEQTILEFDNPNKEIHQLSIYDVQGRLINTYPEISGSKVVVERNGLPGGLYFFELESSEAFVASGKLIVE